MKSLIALVLIVINNAAFAFTQPKQGEKTNDINQYVSTHSEFPKRGFDSFNCSRCSALKNTIFVAPVSTCGTGSCDYMMFEKKDLEATYVTTVSFKPGAFEFLKSSHNGLPDIKIYHHMAANEGIINKMEFDGHTYRFTGPEKKVASINFPKEMKPEQISPEDIK